MITAISNNNYNSTTFKSWQKLIANPGKLKPVPMTEAQHIAFLENITKKAGKFKFKAIYENTLEFRFGGTLIHMEVTSGKRGLTSPMISIAAGTRKAPIMVRNFLRKNDLQAEINARNNLVAALTTRFLEDKNPMSLLRANNNNALGWLSISKDCLQKNEKTKTSATMERIESRLAENKWLLKMYKKITEAKAKTPSAQQAK